MIKRAITPQGQFLFLIGYCLKKSSPLKLLCKMEPNLAGSIYVRSSIKLLHLVPFGQQIWPVAFKLLNVLVLNIAEKLLVGR
jgi:hypothetical protein